MFNVCVFELELEFLVFCGGDLPSVKIAELYKSKAER